MNRFASFVASVLLTCCMLLYSVACRSTTDNETKNPNVSDRSIPPITSGDYIYRHSSRILERWGPDSGSWEFVSVQDAGVPMPSADGGPSDVPGAPGGRTEQVEEGDLYRTVGNTLYYLSTYKGLLVWSLEDPKKPKQIGHLPVFGKPIEMYMSGHTAYILVQDVLFPKQVDGKFVFRKHHSSQLVVVDVRSSQKPRILKRFDFDGRLREGFSRKVGSILYVIAEQAGVATLHSYRIANSHQVVKVQQMGLRSSYRPSSAKGYISPSFLGLTVSATSNALLITELWNANIKSDGCSYAHSIQVSSLRLIDMSDATGRIREHTRFSVEGHVTDQFKQSYAYDPQTKQGIYYGIFQKRGWSSNCGGGSWTTQNRLVSVDISNGSAPVQLDSLVFGKKNEMVYGSLFDHNRKVLYAITAVQTDPLYAISFKDPKNLKILSEIDGLSGDIRVFRLLQGGKVLMGIGRDTSSHCTGFHGGGGWAGTKVAVSLFDVADLTKVRLIQRRCAKVRGNWTTSSSIFQNMDQAHKQFGFLQDATLQAVSVPLYFYGRHAGRYGLQTAVGLMKWDLPAYDPTKSETEQRVLSDLGTILHPHGKVKRSILLHLAHGGQKQRYMVNLSETHMSLVGLQDPTAPKLMASVAMTPYVSKSFAFGDYVAVHMTSSISEWNASHWLSIQKVGAGGVENTVVVENLPLGNVRTIYQWGKFLVVLQNEFNLEASEASGYPIFQQNPSWRVIDLSRPEEARVRGRLPFVYTDRETLPASWSAIRLGTPGQFNVGAGVVSVKDGLLFLISDWSNGKHQRKLHFLNLTNPDAPVLTNQTLAIDPAHFNRMLSFVKDADGRVFLSFREFVRKTTSNDGEWEHHDFRFYVAALQQQGNHWNMSSKINVPGRLLHVYKENGLTYFLTRDSLFVREDKVYRRYVPYTRLHLLRRDGQRALLVRTHSFVGENPKSVLPLKGRLMLSVSASYHGHSQASTYGTSLVAFWPKGKDWTKEYLARFGQMKASFIGGDNGFFLMSLRGYKGVMGLDLRNKEKPLMTHFLRTAQFSGHFLRKGDDYYLSAGYIGLLRFRRGEPSLP